MSVFFTVSHPPPFLSPLSSFLVPHPCRCNHPSLSCGFLFLSAATPCRSTLLYDGRYFTLLPSSNDYLCLRAKREMKAKLFDTADFPLSLSLFSFSFFSFVSFSLSLSLTTSLFYPLSLYMRYISLHLSLSFFPNPFFSFSHPSVTLASPISLSGLHARASFPSYRRAVAILLPPF